MIGRKQKGDTYWKKPLPTSPPDPMISVCCMVKNRFIAAPTGVYLIDG